MSFKLTLTAPACVLDELRSAIDELPAVEAAIGDATDVRAFSPMSLAEIASLTLAIYATTFEPVLPLIRRALMSKSEIVLTTRYGTLKIRGDAPLDETELLQALKPLLPRT